MQSHFEKMWGEVNENIQEQDAEQDIISRVSELKEQNGTINARIDQVMRYPSMCISIGFYRNMSILLIMTS